MDNTLDLIELNDAELDAVSGGQFNFAAFGFGGNGGNATGSNGGLAIFGNANGRNAAGGLASPKAGGAGITQS